LVLVEGQDDHEAYQELFHDRRAELKFHGCGGCIAAEQLFGELESHSIYQRVYLILDRDFRDETEVEETRAAVSARRFVLRRYAMENYLLEPAAVCEELRVPIGEVSSSQVRDELLRICSDLLPVMAANWVFKEAFEAGDSHAKYFREGDDRIGHRSLIVAAAAERLGCSEVNLEEKMKAKEAMIAAALDSGEMPHSFINGKYILFLVHKKFIHANTGPRIKLWRKYLARTVRVQKLIDADLLEIMNRVIRDLPAGL
jgi:hypothetical protein